MSESYVDLSYRDLPLGRRIRLTQVRPSTAFLELQTPMPVGTTIALHTDDGLVFEALVRDLHELVGGSEQVAGMTIAPTLGDEKALEWWQARVTLPEADPKKRLRDRPGTVRPRSVPRAPTPPPVAVEPQPSSPTSVPTNTVPHRPSQPVPMPVNTQPSAPQLVVIEELPPTVEPPTVIFDVPPSPPSPPATAPPVLPENGGPSAHRAATVRAETPTEVETIELPPSQTLLGMAPEANAIASRDSLPASSATEGRRGSIDEEARQKRNGEGELPAPQERHLPEEHPVVDDGVPTVLMDEVDVRGLGLEPSMSGELVVSEVAPLPSVIVDEDAANTHPTVVVQPAPSEPPSEPSEPASEAASEQPGEPASEQPSEPSAPEKKERGGLFRKRKKKR